MAVDRTRFTISRTMDDMPELPDVEVFKRYLDATSLDQRIVRVAVLHKRIVRTISIGHLSRALKGRKFGKSHRHGKLLFVKVDGGEGWLWFHFGMTGYLTYGNTQDTHPGHHVRFLLHFANNRQLRFHCQRLFGQIGMIADVHAYLREQNLGPDALSISQKDFAARACGRTGSVKTMFMNQSVVAGIGNVYSDEILFKARIHPRRPTHTLNTAALHRLYRSMHAVLERAIADDADPKYLPDSWLLPHRQSHAPCPRCGTALTRFIIQQRSAYCCATCQTEKP